MKKYRQFTEDFKRSIVAQIDSGAISKAAAVRENNISPSLIGRWQQQIHDGRMQPRPTGRERQLERELEIVQEERDILKKAVAIFTHPKR